MKSLRNSVWIAVLLPLVCACDAYEAPPIIPQTGSSVASPAEGSSIVLDISTPEAILPFEVTVPDFGMEGNVTYSLEMDLDGAGFSNPSEIGTSDNTTIPVISESLNDELVARGLPLGTASNIQFRVKSSIDVSLMPIYGSKTTLAVTPYDAFVDFPVMYIPGDYQGWNPGNMMTVLKAVNFDKTFTGFIHVLSGSGEFKFTEEPEWVDGKNYGDTGADGTLDAEADASNIKVTEFGTYEVTVDLDAKTYTISGPQLWGIIGSATANGWDSETPMNFNRDLNVLTITTDLAEGEFKFRANQTWDFNLGPQDGELVKDGDNIAIEAAGNYTITLDFTIPGEISYSLTKN